MQAIFVTPDGYVAEASNANLGIVTADRDLIVSHFAPLESVLICNHIALMMVARQLQSPHLSILPVHPSTTEQPLRYIFQGLPPLQLEETCLILHRSVTLPDAAACQADMARTSTNNLIT